MPGNVQSFLLGKRMMPFLERCLERYGAPFTLRPSGGPPWIMFVDPAHIKQIFTASPQVVHTGELGRPLKPLVGENSLLVIDEKQHLDHRRIMLPAFHRERIARLEEYVVDVVEREVESWPRDEELALHPRLQAMSMRIIIRAVFGPGEEGRQIELHGHLSKMVSYLDNELWSLSCFTGRDPRHPGFRRSRAAVHRIVRELIEQARRDPGVAERDGMLPVILAGRQKDRATMNESELLDEVVTLLWTGHEAVASSLAWAFERIARTPEVKAQLAAAAAANGDGDAYLTATVRETLRCRAILPIHAPRLTMEPIEIGGREYPAGVALTAVTYLVHHDPSIYPDPHAFRPDRFLDQQPGTYTWIPFGGGDRRCLGGGLAQMEMKTVLRAVLSRYDVVAPDDEAEPPRMRLTQMTPKNGGRVTLHDRTAESNGRAPARAADASLPPGPRTPKVLQTMAFAGQPLSTLERCRKRYGSRFTLRLVGLPPFVFLSDPDDVRAVFTAPAEVLHPGEGAKVLETLTGKNSLNVLDEDAHLVQRKLMLPAFHGERMRGLTALMAEVAEEEVAGWPLGEATALQPRLRRLTLVIILRTVFGLEAGERLDALRDKLEKVLVMQVAVVPFLQRDFGPYRAWSRFLKLRDEIDALIFQLIEERRAEGGGDDVLSMLLAARHEDGSPMSNQELRDELMTLLVAGHETSATTLAWVFELLVHEPEALARLVAEIDAGEDDDYLTAVLHETLRHRPVLDPPLPRMVKQPFTANGHTYPPGVCLAPSEYLVHHDPALYPEPDKFRPERFLDEQPGTYTWVAFGGGRRRCIGSTFAMVEMKVVVRAVLSRMKVRAAGKEPEKPRRRGPTINPVKGARVVLSERADAPARAEREPASA
jgi:cytochrome P450